MKTQKITVLLTITCLLFIGCNGNSSTTKSTMPEPTKPGETKSMLMRHIPSDIKPGETFTVTLTLDVNESDKPDVIGVTEYYPSGWKASNISYGGLLKEKNSVIEWLFWAMGAKVEDSNITYQLTAPNTGAGTYFFDGNANMGRGYTTNTSGDLKATIQNG